MGFKEQKMNERSELKTVAGITPPPHGTKRPTRIAFTDGTHADTFKHSMLNGIVPGMQIVAHLSSREKNGYIDHYIDNWTPNSYAEMVMEPTSYHPHMVDSSVVKSMEAQAPSHGGVKPIPPMLEHKMPSKDLSIIMQASQKVAAQIATAYPASFPGPNEALSWMLEASVSIANQVLLAEDLTKDPRLEDLISASFGKKSWISPIDIKAAKDIALIDAFRTKISHSEARFRAYVADCNKVERDWRPLLVTLVTKDVVPGELSKYVQDFFPDDSKPNLKVVGGVTPSLVGELSGPDDSGEPDPFKDE